MAKPSDLADQDSPIKKKRTVKRLTKHKPEAAESSVEAKPEPRAEARPEPRPEPKPEPRAEQRPEQRQEPRGDQPRANDRGGDRPSDRGQDRPQDRGNDRPNDRQSDRPNDRGDRPGPQDRGNDRGPIQGGGFDRDDDRGGKRRRKKRRGKMGMGGPMGGGGGGGGGDFHRSGNWDYLPTDEELEREAEELERIVAASGGKMPENQLTIGDLQRMDLDAIFKVAEQEGLEDFHQIPKQDLIFKVLKTRAAKQGSCSARARCRSCPTGSGSCARPN
jgi:hypothetical protein